MQLHLISGATRKVEDELTNIYDTVDPCRKEKTLMATLKAKCAILSAGLLCTLAGLTPAQAQDAMDRVPSKAAIIISMKNAEGFMKEFEAFQKSMGMEEAGPLEQIDQLLSLKGLNRTGSVSMAILPEADGKMNFDADEPNGIIIAPVTNYAEFVKALGAKSAEGIQQISFDGKDGFVKDLGGGYAAISNQKVTLDTYDAKSIQAADRVKAMGNTGTMIRDRSDMFVMVNVPMFKDKIEEGLGTAKEEAAAGPMGAMPGMEALSASMDKMFDFMTSAVGDAQVAVVGLDLSEKGVSLDLGAQFKEGSEMAGFFAQQGDSAKLLNFVPNQPFLVAGAFDTSSESVRKMLKGISDFSKSMQDAVKDMAAAAGQGEGDPTDLFGFMNNTDQLDKIDGTAFVMGANPSGIMGGLFANTSTYMVMKDPTGYRDQAKKALEATNGKKAAGMSFKSNYMSAASTIKGVEVDSWTASIEPSPDDPNGMQMMMAMNMIFGPGGMGGMTAIVDKSVVSTMSQNTQLMTSAITAAKEGKGLGAEASMQAIQAALPKNRLFEFYLGSKSIMDTVAGVGAMMGGEATFTPPEKVSPLAIAGTAEKGGMAFHIHMPSDLIKAIADIQAEMGAMGGDEGEDEEAMEEPAQNDGEPKKAPRF